MYRVHHQVISKVLLTVFMEVLQASGLIGKERKTGTSEKASTEPGEMTRLRTVYK